MSSRGLTGIVTAGAWTVSAWTLLPDHFHVLGNPQTRPLAKSSGSLLTRHARAFTRLVPLRLS